MADDLANKEVVTCQGKRVASIDKHYTLAFDDCHKCGLKFSPTEMAGHWGDTKHKGVLFVKYLGVDKNGHPKYDWVPTQ